MAKIKASWLTELQSDLNTNNSSKDLPTITAISKNSGDIIKADDINTFITRLKNLSSNTFIKHALWSNYDTTLKDSNNIIKEATKTNLEGLIDELKTINGNYSVSTTNSNTSNSNFTGFNRSTFSRTSEAGFSGNTPTFSQLLSFNQTCSQTTAGFTKEGCNNVGSFTQTYAPFFEACTITYSANTTTSHTNTSNTIKNANFGQGYSNNTLACTQFTKSGFTTESNCTQTFTPGTTSFSKSATFTQTTSFSDTEITTFSKTCVNCTDRSFEGGNSKTCTTTLQNFSVRGTTVISNSNFSK